MPQILDYLHLLLSQHLQLLLHPSKIALTVQLGSFIAYIKGGFLLFGLSIWLIRCSSRCSRARHGCLNGGVSWSLSSNLCNRVYSVVSINKEISSNIVNNILGVGELVPIYIYIYNPFGLHAWQTSLISKCS